MGATFGNIQILNEEKLDKDIIIERIIKGFKDLDYEVCKDNHSDLNLKILYNPLSKWICLYNEVLDAITIRDLKKQTLLYKDMFNTDVIASHVYDGDVLMMSLNGSKKDFYISDSEETYKDIIGYNPKTSKGSIKKWIHLLEEQYQEQDLKDIWGKNFIFAEEKLANIGKILGFSEVPSKYGYSSFEFIPKDELCDYEVINISFVNQMKPYKIIYKEGLPALSWKSSAAIFNINDEIHLEVQNKGGKSKGFDVILFGDVINKTLFSYGNVKITTNCSIDYDDVDIIGNQPLKDGKFEDGTKVLLAAFNDLEIPQGIDVEYYDEIQQKLGISHRKIQEEIMDYRQKTNFTFRFNAYAKEKATGQVQIIVVPHENRIPQACAYFEFIISNDKDYIEEFKRKSFEAACKKAKENL